MFRNTIIATLCLVFGGAALAGAARQTASSTDDLRRTEARVGDLAGRTKGGPQHQLLLEKQRIHRLVEDLEAGKAVDPREIDDALDRAGRLP